MDNNAKTQILEEVQKLIVIRDQINHEFVDLCQDENSWQYQWKTELNQVINNLTKIAS